MPIPAIVSEGDAILQSVLRKNLMRDDPRTQRPPREGEQGAAGVDA